MRILRLTSFGFILVGTAACDDEPAAKPLATAPRLARPTETPAGKHVAYQLSAPSEVTFEVRAKELETRGTFPVMRGELQIDLVDLKRSRGHVAVDVAALRMRSFESDADNKEQAERARNWLNLGSSKPEAERERLRWARFTIREVTESNAATFREGKRVKRKAPEADADVADDSDASPPPAPAETRLVKLKVLGDFELNGYRVERSAHLEMEADFDDDDAPLGQPDRVRVRTRSPFPVGLRAHDIKPRDSKGTTIATELKLIPLKVSYDAQVNLFLEATPKGG